ncbi:MAG: hypothetical protein L0K86_12645 [Actinomycetia bacterium]|nr:hypothetical protein [Actinomycetes bacterium]
MHCGGDHAGAEDLVQDALLKTFRRWRRIKDPGARFAYTLSPPHQNSLASGPRLSPQHSCPRGRSLAGSGHAGHLARPRPRGTRRRVRLSRRAHVAARELRVDRRRRRDR